MVWAGNSRRTTISAHPFSIGVGGHQELGDDATQHFVAHQFREVLITYQRQGYDITVYSALAKGADQLFMRVALELAIAVEVIIPCKDYEKNYRGDEKQEYWRLYHAARARHLLAFPECRESAYEAAGHWIVERGDLTVLAWNGKPPAGRGGTADMAHHARFLGKSFLHLHTLDHIATLYQFSHSPAVFQEEPGEAVLIVPVVHGKQELVLLTEKTSQLDFPRASHIESQALQQALRRDIGYQAGRFEVIGSAGASGKVEVVVASDLTWNPISSEQSARIHTRTLTDVVAWSGAGERFNHVAALALAVYAESREELP